jgi:hypothetical protein
MNESDVSKSWILDWGSANEEFSVHCLNVNLDFPDAPVELATALRPPFAMGSSGSLLHEACRRIVASGNLHSFLDKNT